MVTSLVLHRFNAKGRSFVASRSARLEHLRLAEQRERQKSKQMEAFSDTAHDWVR